MSIAYICAGSNIGDRIGYIQQAHSLLNDTENIHVLESSSFYETEPVGHKDQEWFINAVLKVQTALSPEELLNQCLRIEKQLGRKRSPDMPKNMPRTLDLDILFYDDKIISGEMLEIPHSKVHVRAFALVPMLELDAEFVHPVLEKNISELHESLEEPEEVYLYGTRGINF
jgi:2-amino-4-hydroxy-6-hydroxymethyldihydropteridine diphosphokinase